MLQKLNERIQGVVTWVIVGLVTLTFTLVGLDYYFQSKRDSDIKAQVNGQRVTKQAFELNYRRISQMQDQNALTAETVRALKQQVLSEMVVNTVSVEAARAYGFEVNSNQATAAILHIPQFQEDGHFSTSRYTQALTNAFFTPQTFEQEVKQGMLLNQQRFALIGTSFVLPNELEQFVRLSTQTRDYGYALISSDNFIAKMQLSDKEVENYYQQHQETFYSQEKVSIDYIRLSLQDIKKSLHVDPKTVFRYYEDNKSNYLTPAQWQLAFIRFPLEDDAPEALQSQSKQRADNLYEKLLADPTRFDELAMASSEKSSEHGLAPLVVAGQSELDQQLVNLTQQGQISAPIKTKLGYEIFKLISYAPATPQVFLKVKPLIEEQLTQEAAQKQYADAVEQLSDLSYQNPDSLDFVAETLHVPIAHSALFSRNGGKDELTKNKDVLQAVFGQEVLVFGNNSDPIQLDADDIVVLRVKQHIPAALQPLSKVRTPIAKALIKQKAVLEAERFGHDVVSRALPEATIASLNWHVVDNVGRDSDAVESRINDLAFAMSHTKEYAGVTLDNGDFAVVRLSHVHNGKLNSLDKEQIDNVSQQIEASYGLLDYDLYINRLMNQAKIIKY